MTTFTIVPDDIDKTAKSILKFSKKHADEIEVNGRKLSTYSEAGKKRWAMNVAEAMTSIVMEGKERKEGGARKCGE